MRHHRLISLLLAMVLVISLVPTGAFAGEAGGKTAAEPAAEPADGQETEPSSIEGTEATSPAEETEDVPSNVIEAIAPLTSKEKNQTVQVRSGQQGVFPTTLSVKCKGESAYKEAAVTWEKNPSTYGSKPQTVRCTPAFTEDYILAEGVELPTITINVVRAATKISGLNKKPTKKARYTLKDTITVSPAYGRKVKVQMKEGGKWKTKKTITLGKTKSYKFTLSYPNSWWKKTSSSWRLYLSASNEGKAYTSPTIKVKAKRYYQNPSKYVQIKDKITLRHSGSYNLKVGYMGLKVRKVNSYFHMGSRYWPRYTYTTKRKVKAFQKRKGLKATGIVDKKTWKKMGFSESSWKKLGAYVSPIKVNPSSTKKQHIEAMISTAKKYLGADYVVGASGSPAQGADCSGLIMQGLYAAGVDPYPVSCVRHSKPGYEYESRNLYKSKKFKKVSYAKKKRGDLIFYAGRGGAIIHVAIYLGNGKVIESWPNRVVIWPIRNSHRSRIAGVRRVFN